jgi:hypothetical protein
MSDSKADTIRYGEGWNLYADDLTPDPGWEVVTIPHSHQVAAIDAVRPLLRRRCPMSDGKGHHPRPAGQTADLEGEYTCAMCEGRGWLYPEQPDWWEGGRILAPTIRAYSWEEWCDGMWRVMGLYQEG